MKSGPSNARLGRGPDVTDRESAATWKVWPEPDRGERFQYSLAFLFVLLLLRTIGHGVPRLLGFVLGPVGFSTQHHQLITVGLCLRNLAGILSLILDDVPLHRQSGNDRRSQKHGGD